MADGTPGAEVSFDFPGSQGDLEVKGDHAYLSATSSGGGCMYLMPKEEMCPALHAALDTAVANGWLFGQEFTDAYWRWREEPREAGIVAQALAVHHAQAALWEAESHRVSP